MTHSLDSINETKIILSYEDFYAYIKSLWLKDSEIENQFWFFSNTLQSIKNKIIGIEEDPIKYLHNLYFETNLTHRKIQNELKKHQINYTTWTMSRNFQLLWWRKDKTNAHLDSCELNKKKEEIRNFNKLKIDCLLDLYKCNENEQFNYNTYNWFRFNQDKIWYLLECFWYWKREEFPEILHTLSKQYSQSIVAEVFNLKIANIISLESLSMEIPYLHSSSVQRISAKSQYK